jgi:acetoin utilization deacetylase AcuC-like enzyme
MEQGTSSTDGRVAATRIGLVFDELFLEHVPAAPHPECPARLEVCLAGLIEARLLEIFVPVPARPATLEELSAVHDRVYLERLESLRGETGHLDPDTYLAPRSIEAAFAAAGGTIDLAAAVLDDRIDTGLALVRPPGHHALRSRAMGFCILGNAALAATVARSRGLRPAVVDFDVHHGNGTQATFYDDERVFFASTHRFGGGFFPGTGSTGETGTGRGLGSTLNVPLAAGSGDRELLEAFDHRIGPALERFRPDLIIVSAGFDAHRRDPLGGLTVTDEGFAAIVDRIASWSDALCRGKWIAVLEGGYDGPALSQGVILLAQALGPGRG